MIAIKTTVYRTSDDSTLVGALIDCAEQGKQSVCLVELKARFDERRNIEWSRAMEQAGVHVVHGFSDLKIHAKMALVVRREGDALRRYVHIGSGNYNAATARLYEDVGIFTADEEIAADVADLFNHLTGFGRPQRFRKLLVAPFSMRARLIDEIRRVAAAAAAGEKTRIRLKLNQLVDPRADRGALRGVAGGRADRDLRSRDLHAPTRRAGAVGDDQRPLDLRTLPRAQPRLLVRDRGASTMFIGSADLMPRNLDHRVEVLMPVESGRTRQELNAILDSVFADNTNAWELSRRRQLAPASRPRRASAYTHQAVLRRRVTLRARRRHDGRGRPR